MQKHRGGAAPAASTSSPLDEVSQLLWVGFGLGRHGSGGRCAPAARRRAAAEVYVCLADGCYRYEAPRHALLPVSPDDARPFFARPGTGPAPAFALVYVADHSDERQEDDEECGQLPGEGGEALATRMADYCRMAGFRSRRCGPCDPRVPALLRLLPDQQVVLGQAVTLHPKPH